MNIKKVDDKPMVIHTKEKAKIQRKDKASCKDCPGDKNQGGKCPDRREDSEVCQGREGSKGRQHG